MTHDPLNIGIPQSEYDRMLSIGRCTPAAKAVVSVFLDRVPYSRMVLFGASATGQALKAELGERFAGFVDSGSLASARPGDGDCVIITTASVHAEAIELALSRSALAALPVFRLFREQDLNIRLILETQPRCGTGYTLGNLRRCYNLGTADTFFRSCEQTTADGLIGYVPADCDGYVVKTHFTRPLHYPQYRYCPTLFLLGYFPDTYYRWARLEKGGPPAERERYFLSADSREWQWIKSYIPLHLQWLDYIHDKRHLRYEDYFTDFDGVMDTFAALLGERPKGFEEPRQISSRMYWTGEYAAFMDDEVWTCLKTAFGEQLRRYYPEKC